MLWLFVLMVLLFLVVGGVGLAVEGMKLLLVVALLLAVAAFLTGRKVF